jgi:hypothetical protein
VVHLKGAVAQLKGRVMKVVCPWNQWDKVVHLKGTVAQLKGRVMKVAYVQGVNGIKWCTLKGQWHN